MGPSTNKPYIRARWFLPWKVRLVPFTCLWALALLLMPELHLFWEIESRERLKRERKIETCLLLWLTRQQLKRWMAVNPRKGSWETQPQMTDGKVHYFLNMTVGGNVDYGRWNNPCSLQKSILHPWHFDIFHDNLIYTSTIYILHWWCNSMVLGQYR